MKYLIDTDVLIDAFIGIRVSQRILDRIGDERSGLSIISCGELWEGVVGAADPAQRATELDRHLGRFDIVMLSRPEMEIFAQVRAQLRRSGLLIPDLERPAIGDSQARAGGSWRYLTSR